MKDLEIIIVDEGDKDRCREIIDYFEARDPRIVAPHQKNGGYGASCNLGIAMARGEYISIIESDDYIDLDMYEKMYEYAAALDADVVKIPFREYFQNGSSHDCSYRTYLSNCLPKNKTFSMKEFGQLLEVHASLWSGIYRREYLNKYNIRFVEAKGAGYVDVGFRIDTLINSNKIAYLDSPFYNYRVDSENSSTNSFKLAPMIQRWTEQHKMFEAIYDDYSNYYGGHLIIDEYLNTVGWLFLIDATQEEYDQISANLESVSVEMIEKSHALNKKQKKDLILFKKDPNKFRKHVKMTRCLRNMSISVNRVLDKFSDIHTLMWFFITMLSVILFRCMIYFHPDTVIANNYISAFGDGVALLSFLGCMACFGAKITRRFFGKLKDIYKRRQNIY